MEWTILRELPFSVIQAKAHLGEVEAASWLVARPEEELETKSTKGAEVEDDDVGGALEAVGLELPGASSILADLESAKIGICRWPDSTSAIFSPGAPEG